MKRSMELQTVLIVSLLLVPQVAAASKTDKERAGLIGPVQTVSTISVSFWMDQNGQSIVRRENGPVVTYDSKGNEVETVYYDSPDNGGSRYSKDIHTYNAQGKKVKTVEYNSDGSPNEKRVYTYGSRGELAREARYDALGDLIDKTTYTYNSQENLKEAITYDEDDDVNSRSISAYDAQGNLMEVTHYDEVHDAGLGIEKTVEIYDLRGNIIENITYYTTGSPPARKISTYKYDAKGNIIARTNYANDLSPVKTIFTYEFDSMGNWIKQTSLSDHDANSDKLPDKHLLTVTNRTITYYEEGKKKGSRRRRSHRPERP